MWQQILGTIFRGSGGMQVLRTYAPYVTFPIAVVIGTIGYNLESLVSDKHTPSRETAIERREKRREGEKEEEFTLPKTIFERNTSPTLKPPE